MPRSVYSGTLGWGLVNVPVKLYSARNPKTIKFKQVNKDTGALVKQKRVDANTGNEVPYGNIVKGYEIAPDRFVLVDPDELANLSAKQTKRIDIEQFIHLGEIDPVVYDDSYFLAPETGAEKVYRLLGDTMRDDGRAAVGRIVLYGKQKLCVIRPNPVGVLVCSTAVLADELNDHVWIAAPIADPANASSEAERQQAGALIDAFAKPFDHAAFRDEYRGRVMELIQAKAAGEELVSDTSPVEAAPAPNLLGALQASVAAVNAKRADTAPVETPERMAA